MDIGKRDANVAENSLGIVCACGPVGKIVLTKHFLYAREIADYSVHKKTKRFL